MYKSLQLGTLSNVEDPVCGWIGLLDSGDYFGTCVLKVRLQLLVLMDVRVHTLVR